MFGGMQMHCCQVLMILSPLPLLFHDEGVTALDYARLLGPLHQHWYERLLSDIGSTREVSPIPQSLTDGLSQTFESLLCLHPPHRSHPPLHSDGFFATAVIVQTFSLFHYFYLCNCFCTLTLNTVGLF